jgi:hypothetical protein
MAVSPWRETSMSDTREPRTPTKSDAEGPSAARSMTNFVKEWKELIGTVAVVLTTIKRL